MNIKCNFFLDESGRQIIKDGTTSKNASSVGNDGSVPVICSLNN